MKLHELPAQSVPLPWHEEAWGQLTRQFEQGQLPHALMLQGPPGVGKAQFALAAARLLLCDSPRGGVNCGECHGCQLSAAGNHGDLRWVQPEAMDESPAAGSNKERKSRVIRIEQVRDAIAFTQGTASFGERQVAVFAPADRLNVNGYNALLKSLEEPAGDTFLLLVCDRVHGVPATIRSRCQALRLPAPARQAAMDWLQAMAGDEGSSSQLLELAGGSPLLAASLLDSGEAQDLALRQQALRALFAGQVSADQVWQSWRDCEPAAFLDQFSGELRELLRQLPAPRLAGPQGRAAFALLDEALDLQRAVDAGANPGKQLLVDVLLAKCHRLLGSASHGDTI
jgi:DNA polymerase-3 subunit delta'